MPKPSSDLIVGLDIGTSKVLAIVGEVGAHGGIEVIGIGHHPSRGLRKGVVATSSRRCSRSAAPWRKPR